jgi:hypothetical protein
MMLCGMDYPVKPGNDRKERGASSRMAEKEWRL